MRGFTRDVDGKKLFIDHDITSIQDYLAEDTKQAYQMIDVNVYQENMFHTKMLLKDFELWITTCSAPLAATSPLKKRGISKAAYVKRCWRYSTPVISIKALP